MTRHSFIQMSKLSNVRGRISYITSHAKQENLYATYRTADHSFWSNLARESQQEFQRSGAEGKCIEARELIIALPETYTQYEPQQVLKDFTEEFRRRYDVECVSALHHNKRKTNYHIHLIFSERRLLAEPEVKIATRSVFFDETGKRVRTKKEVMGEDGQIRKGCTVIPKGGVYEQHLFTVKDGRFKSEPFLEEVKRNYTALINRHIADPEQHLRVFNPDSIYLPTKKIGKNNPKAAEMEADNAARQEWNRTADMALVSGIEEAKILEVKKEEIHQKASQSIKAHGWLPNLFRCIVNKAKEFLQNLIRYRKQSEGVFAEPDTPDGAAAQAGAQSGYGGVSHHAEADDTGAGQSKGNPQFAGGSPQAENAACRTLCQAFRQAGPQCRSRDYALSFRITFPGFPGRRSCTWSSRTAGLQARWCTPS